ncbi:MAG TPA: hypothetical protein VEX40_09540, partial [Mycobacterium sp.]|nr:hypothetical protein [Mycobacterium sp.]
QLSCLGLKLQLFDTRVHETPFVAITLEFTEMQIVRVLGVFDQRSPVAANTGASQQPTPEGRERLEPKTGSNRDQCSAAGSTTIRSPVVA